MAKKKTTTKKAAKAKAPKEVTCPVERARATHPKGSDATAWPKVEQR
jgi:hypothetical protein